jgi:hypothetical protein
MIDINAFDPLTLVLLAALNPVVIAIAVVMGRGADQWQKLPIAAFAASVAGFLLYWLLCQVGVFKVHALGGEAGLVVIQFLYAFLLSALVYRLARRRRT